MATLFKSHAIKQSCKLNVQIGITGGKKHAMIKKKNRKVPRNDMVWKANNNKAFFLQ